jgi:taurine dioxygenase
MTTLQRPGVGPRILDRLAPGTTPRTFRRFAVVPQAATLGGLVEGLDLREPCDDELRDEILAALAEWKVLLFRDQHLTVEQHAAFADRFGRLTDDTLVASTSDDPVDNVVVFVRDAQTVALENEWHADGTFRPMPTIGTILRAIEVPAVGGDTLFADMAAAFDNLPTEVQQRIVTLDAVNDWSIGAYAAKYGDRLEELRRELPPVVHPVVIRHPVTGRATLYVNRLFTQRIVGLDPDESDALLDLLFRQVSLPELQVRWRWEPGSIAMWDNLACQHYGANDYFPQRRVMARTTFFSRTIDRLEPFVPAGVSA